MAAIRKRWIVFSFVLGAAVIATGVFTEAAWGWSGIWPSVFLEVGAGIALAGFLFLLERLFVRETVQRAAEAAEQRIEERVQPLEEEVARQRTRLDELGGRADRVAAERDSEVNEVIAAVERDVTFDTVAAALGAGIGSGGLHSSYRVRCEESFDALRVEFDVAFTESESGDRQQLLFARLTDFAGDAVPQRVPWEPGTDAARFTDSIRHQLEVVNLPRYRFDPEVAFRNLIDGIDLAVRSRRGDGPRMVGRLIERMTTDIVLSDAGLESLRDGLIMGAHEFPQQAYSKAADARPQPEVRPPRAPPGINDDDWAAIVEVARRTFPLPPAALLAMRL